MPDLYAAVDFELIRFSLANDSGALDRMSSIRMPGRVQEAWPHASLPVLYVVCGDRRSDPTGLRFCACAVRAGSDGSLRMYGEPVQLPARPIHATTDLLSRHVLTAYNDPPGLTVHEIGLDGTIGREIPIAQPFDHGVYPHQVRVAPSNDRGILVARGHSGRSGPVTAPGSLKLFAYNDGRVANLSSVEMAGTVGLGTFNVRHLDFHPNLPLVYVSLEAQNVMAVLRFDSDTLQILQEFTRDLLADRSAVSARQLAGTIHVHPTGRWVYVVNRADGRQGDQGWVTTGEPPVFEGGENSIVVFALDPVGRPTLVQRTDTRGLSARTFALDPSGRVLVAANSKRMIVQAGSVRKDVSASLAVFRVDSEGRLSLAREYPVEVGPTTLWWCGIV